MHTLHDGAVVKLMGAKELAAIPPWKGNRILDMDHVVAIRSAIGDKIQCLDSGYRIVSYMSVDAAGRPVRESGIVDGQHRAQVLKAWFETNLCEPDFPVVVIEKYVETETDVIDYFNALNNVKPIHYSDPNLIAGEYIKELERAFNTDGVCLIRLSATRRPYLCVDKLREGLLAHKGRLSSSRDARCAFVDRVRAWNAKQIAMPADMLARAKKSDGDCYERALKLNWMLACDPKLPWIAECL
jgi:hypothetical protein